MKVVEGGWIRVPSIDKHVVLIFLQRFMAQHGEVELSALGERIIGQIQVRQRPCHIACLQDAPPVIDNCII
jgi:hypothetical protein